uniref:Aminopeptidase n=1 Tax=Anopheles dirus TaxID=7168 RepID=A0A182NDS1_9DIPT
SNYRLPNNTSPLRYNIELTTRIHDSALGIDRFKFEGKVTIQLKTINDQALTSDVTLNYRQIDITHVKLWYISQDGWEYILLDDSDSFTTDPIKEFLTVHSPQPLNGTYFLELKYNGTLREDNAGLYRSSYYDQNGNVRWLATTQFSSTDARHAFPCYDEPGIRAPIGLRVIHGKQYSVLSNTIPIDVRDSILDGMVITTFTDTPKMQPYLLGIVVSDFKAASLPDYPRQQAYARPTAFQKPVADFIIEAGFKVLQVLEDFLDTPYILPKLYHVAIPDFAPGAMENYGLITYKEENFIFDSSTSPMKQRKKIATIVAHEIGHHYFGNYVSPAWWSFLWMKEGFARFFEYVAAEMVFPELGIGNMYAVDKTHNVFEIDSLGSTRPMTYYVNTQSEISNVFDDIAYDKGGAILLMFYHAFDHESFRRALVNYLHANALQSATPAEFADAMQQTMFDGREPENVQFNASSLLKSWTEQAGYPILHISRIDANCSLQIHQERYLLKSSNTSSSAVTWIIPFNFATKLQPNFENTLATGWLTETSVVINPTNELFWTCDDWIVFNKQQTSYYRINYDTNLWQLNIEALLKNSTIFHEANRAQLIDDSMNNARSGRLEYQVTLQLMRYLSKELDYIPWAAADRNLGLLNILMRGTNKYTTWHKYCLEFIEPTYLNKGIVTSPQDTMSDRMVREIVVNWACKVGSQHCLNATALMVTEVAESHTADVDPDLRESIYCNGLRSASSAVFDSIWQRMQESQDQAYRSELIRALGCVDDAQLIDRYLSTTTETNYSSYFGQERERVFVSVLKNGLLGMEKAINFLKENMDDVNVLYNKGNFGARAISSIVRNMAKHITSESMHIQFQNLMEQLLEKRYLLQSDMLQALEYSSENLMWIHDRGVQIEIWLEQQYPQIKPQTSTSELTTSSTVVMKTTKILSNTMSESSSISSSHSTTYATNIQTTINAGQSNVSSTSSIPANNSILSLTSSTTKNYEENTWNHAS